MQTLTALKNGEYKGATRLKLAEGLREIPAEVFDLADTLEVLDLSGNRLSSLPAAFTRLKRLKVLFLSDNAFTVWPEVLGQLPRLSMIGFKANRIEHIAEDTLPLNTRWLILTDNRLQALPESIGKLASLQKLMLAGNRLRRLPESLQHCENLQLARLSANQLEVIPDWLLRLPKLSWLAFAGNRQTRQGPAALSSSELAEITAAEVEIHELLGEGASGLIHRAEQGGEPVALKLFKGDVTSDGHPHDEMAASFASGRHPNLVEVVARYAEGEQKGLLMKLICRSFSVLGQPPSFETCTRDTFDKDQTFGLGEIIRIAHQVADVMAHLHQRKLAHGDLYAHNLLVNEAADVLLSDFGAATLYSGLPEQQHALVERLEVRAFGCLLDDLLGLYRGPRDLGDWLRLEALRDRCLLSDVPARPNFAQLLDELALTTCQPPVTEVAYTKASHSTSTL